MIPFTLYCFAKVFHLSYSGSTPKLLNLFEEGTSSEALTKVVYGKTDSTTYAERIDLNRPQAQKTLKSIQQDRLKYAYQHLIRKKPDDLSKEELAGELLEYALLRDKDEQADVYDRKDTVEVKQYIEQLRNKALQNGLLTDCNQEPYHHKTNHPVRIKKQPLPEIEAANMTTHSFFTSLEQHFDEIDSLQISCHAGDIWLRPSSYRYRLLKRLCEYQIPIHVIINSLPATEVIWQHMRDTEAYEMGMYRSIEDITNAWKIMSASRKNIVVRVCDIPLLHNYICINFQSEVPSLMRIGMYTYGKPLEESHPHLYFAEQDEHFPIMKNEFEYLWSLSEPIA